MKMSLIEALKKECIISANNGFSGYLKKEKTAVNVSAYARNISKRLSDKHHTVSVEKCRYHLKNLERKGIVVSKRHLGGATRWWPVGFLKELNNQDV